VATACPALAEMVAVALEQFPVRHPLLWADALRAQDIVATELDCPYEKRVPYTPYWAVS
jgi:hypothetical protein